MQWTCKMGSDVGTGLGMSDHADIAFHIVLACYDAWVWVLVFTVLDYALTVMHTRTPTPTPLRPAGVYALQMTTKQPV